MTGSWTVIVPVKGTGDAKSRLGGTPRSRRMLAKAIALDTVESVLATPGVGMVLVVTSQAASDDFAALGATVLVDTGAGGLNGAISRGIISVAALHGMGIHRGGTFLPDAAAVKPGGVAVLLGDVPALAPGELSAALAAAAGHPLAMVADADDSGTVLIAATGGVRLTPAFGPGSRAAHRALGYVELAVSASSGLRRDVDTIEQLQAIVESEPPAARRTAAAFVTM